jgi:hypothetical protein
LTAAKTAYTDANSYGQATEAAAELPAIEPSLCYVAAGTASADVTTCNGTAANVQSFKVVSVSVTSVAGTDKQIWSGAVLSKSGKCFYIKDVASGTGAGTFYGTGATCTGTAAASGATAGSW